MIEPDWDKLTAANDELEQLGEAGKLTKDDFTRLLKSATEAVGEHEEYLEGFLMRSAEYGFEP